MRCARASHTAVRCSGRCGTPTFPSRAHSRCSACRPWAWHSCAGVARRLDSPACLEVFGGACLDTINQWEIAMELTINGAKMNVAAADDTPLLWALRDRLGMTGTKFGCGMALCGACTVHVDGVPTRACITP